MCFRSVPAICTPLNCWPCPLKQHCFQCQPIHLLHLAHFSADVDDCRSRENENGHHCYSSSNVCGQLWINIVASCQSFVFHPRCNQQCLLVLKKKVIRSQAVSEMSKFFIIDSLTAKSSGEMVETRQTKWLFKRSPGSNPTIWLRSLKKFSTP